MMSYQQQFTLRIVPVPSTADRTNSATVSKAPLECNLRFLEGGGYSIISLFRTGRIISWPQLYLERAVVSREPRICAIIELLFCEVWTFHLGVFPSIFMQSGRCIFSRMRGWIWRFESSVTLTDLQIYYWPRYWFSYNIICNNFYNFIIFSLWTCSFPVSIFRHLPVYGVSIVWNARMRKFYELFEVFLGFWLRLLSATQLQLPNIHAFSTSPHLQLRKRMLA